MNVVMLLLVIFPAGHGITAGAQFPDMASCEAALKTAPALVAKLRDDDTGAKPSGYAASCTKIVEMQQGVEG